MKMDTYKKAVELQSKIHRLELIEADLAAEGFSPIECYDPDTGGSFKCDADVMEKISASALAIIKLEIRNLRNDFLAL